MQIAKTIKFTVVSPIVTSLVYRQDLQAISLQKPCQFRGILIFCKKTYSYNSFFVNQIVN